MGQDNPSPAELAAFSNTQKLECKLRLERDTYLPDERARLAVTIGNPSNSPLEVRAPFQQRSGGFYVAKVFDGGGEEFMLSDDSGLQPARFNVPTMIMQPGQEVTQTIATNRSSQFRIPGSSGMYRVKYSYAYGAGADFRVIDISAAKLWAVSLVHLQPEEVLDEVGRASMKRACVPFFAVETSPGEHWLLRGDPDTRRDISPSPNREFTLDVLLSQLIGFERVKQLDEPVTSMRMDLRADETVDVIAETASHRQIMLHVPARPAKAPAARLK
jgi:hypothetical protein